MKRAFTLVEMLAILVVLGIITLVSVPSIVSTNKQSRENNYNQYKKNVENAAEMYVETHPDDYTALKTTSGTSVTIDAQDLIAAGLIQGGLQNPNTEKKLIEEATTVNVVNESGTLKYTYNGP